MNASSSSMQQRQYQFGHHVGSENRHLEFKAGPAFKENLRKGTARYMCAFINARVDGMIMLGVDDDGYVKGCSLTHQEKDRCQLKIDDAVKELNPKVFTQSYSVDFIDVVNTNGESLQNLYVIEIGVKGASVSHDSLYSCNEGAFLRRDAGVQKLTPQDIQQWVRQNGRQESNELRKELNKVKNQYEQRIGNMDRTLTNLRKENDNVRNENTQLQQSNKAMEIETEMLKQRVKEHERAAAANNDVRQELASVRGLIEQQQNKKSKVCSIM